MSVVNTIFKSHRDKIIKVKYRFREVTTRNFCDGFNLTKMHLSPIFHISFNILRHFIIYMYIGSYLLSHKL